MLNGLQTAGKVRNLESGVMYWSVNYYNVKGELVEAVVQNHIGGIDRTINEYDFVGRLTKATRKHSSSTVSNLEVVTSFKYDHWGRKLETREKIGNGGEVLLSKLEYNDVGVLIGKKLHDELQSTSYTYNERGWLKTSNSTQFSLELKYQDAVNGVAPQYAGNISNQVYNNGGSSIITVR